MKCGGLFNGTGADLYVCIGFVPDWVRIWNLEGTQRILLEWNKMMSRSAEIVDGIQLTAADQTAAALTSGNGLKPYVGGDTLTTTTAGTTTYGEGSYLKWDNADYRYVSNTALGIVGDAVAVNIDTWTLDTSANRTGHFNEDATGTYIGEGSRIIIDGVEYSIVALTAGQGEASDEVTLDRAAPSGNVEYISGMYDMKPMIAGEVTAPGFLISNTNVNVNNALIAFEAGQYDR